MPLPARLRIGFPQLPLRWSGLSEETVMTIPTIEYKGFVLRAYSKKIFPTYHDPYASGPKQFTSVVLIDTVPSSGTCARRYSTVFSDSYPPQSSDAIDLAMEYGKNIIDGGVQAKPL
jgi:hypothetical protein